MVQNTNLYPRFDKSDVEKAFYSKLKTISNRKWHLFSAYYLLTLHINFKRLSSYA